MNVTLIVTVCSKTLNSAKRLGGIIHKVLNKATDPKIQEKLMQFSMQIVHNKPLFTAYGLFLIDGSLIFTVRELFWSNELFFKNFQFLDCWSNNYLSYNSC